MDPRLVAFGFRPRDAYEENRNRGREGWNDYWHCGEVDGMSVCMDPITLVIEREFVHATDGRAWAGRHVLCERHALACGVKATSNNH